MTHAQTPNSEYQAYLLRIWRDHNPSKADSPWRFSLEDPHTGARRGFQSLELLMIFLRAQIKAPFSRDQTNKDGG
jgi:hypothetical protein